MTLPEETWWSVINEAIPPTYGEVVRVIEMGDHLTFIGRREAVKRVIEHCTT